MIDKLACVGGVIGCLGCKIYTICIRDDLCFVETVARCLGKGD